MLSTLYLISASGWASALLVAVTTTLPYVLHRWVANPQMQWLGPFLLRLRPHYWLGYIIVGLSVFHAFLAMNRQIMNGTNNLGLWLATGGLFLMFWQVMLGRRLKQRTENRQVQRRWHFTLMLGIVALGAAHIILNSVLFRVLIN